MVRNATKYYFPIRESIMSVLPVVDEFVVALGQGDPDDRTREVIGSIGSEKIRIYDRVWNESDFIDGKVFAGETNFALSQCRGDWCIYLQADEVIHEKDHEKIATLCEKYHPETRVDGFLLRFKHFFGDYEHYLPYHGWYKNEIRIIRNHAGIYSYKDAQSFRKNDDEKLNVVRTDADVFHYGWVRPPHLMQSKKKEQDSMHHGKDKTREEYRCKPKEFSYGALGNIPVYPGTHPVIMEDFRKKINWKEKLNYSKKAKLDRPKMKHEKAKYRFITMIENIFNHGKDLFGYTNWNIIRIHGK